MDDATLTRQLRSARRWNYALLAFCLLNASAAAWAFYTHRADRAADRRELRTGRLVLSDVEGASDAAISYSHRSLDVMLDAQSDRTRADLQLTRTESEVRLGLGFAGHDRALLAASDVAGRLQLGGESGLFVLSQEPDEFTLRTTIPGRKMLDVTLKRGLGHLRLVSGRNWVALMADEHGAAIEQQDSGASEP